LLCLLYALCAWLRQGIQEKLRKLLLFQGILSALFIVESLTLWSTEIAIPEISRLQLLKNYGIEYSFDLQMIGLRNWFPIGHQNYVAGYLILVLPLLFSFALSTKGWQQFFWGSVFLLGCIDLYTTYSRGGFISFFVWFAVSAVFMIFRRGKAGFWKWPSLTFLLISIAVLVLSNQRVRSLSQTLLSGQPSEAIAYRLITNAAGWRMGLAHPIAGVGIGSVPLSYQRYRPFWAGREAELVYQLHSTPAQLWAEMGFLGILLPILTGALLLRLGWRYWKISAAQRSPLPSVLTGGLYGGLLSYGLYSITDYQIDNLCIAFTIVIFVAALAATFYQVFEGDKPQRNGRKAQPAVIAFISFLLALNIWFTLPVHRSWQLSEKGFHALYQGDFDNFIQKLTKAHSTTPWEPYYPYQLGWNLGELASQQTAVSDFSSAIRWFQTGLQIAPDQEFGYSNLGWLQQLSSPEEGVYAFMRSAQLVPAKRGIFFGLGLSLWQRGEVEYALKAWSIEILRHPILITSSFWQLPQFEPIYADLLKQSEQLATALLADTKDHTLEDYLYQVRGTIKWWQNDLKLAQSDWSKLDSSLFDAMFELIQTSTVSPEKVDLLSRSPAKAAIQAWIEVDKREQYLTQAWLLSQYSASVGQPLDLPQDLLEELKRSMDKAPSFNQWLKNSPVRQIRNHRLGFGSLSRHVDGPTPKDFLPRAENIALSNFFEMLVLSPKYFPELDTVLQPHRQVLIDYVANTT
ncbi:MAG: polymerase, partial [Leptolyngbya sp. SIO4C1]|nr:polymerase [Leptolyngbya sp. SIO4C1]